MKLSPKLSGQTALAYLMLLPGLGLILVFMVVIVSLTVAQSLGYYNFSGESGLTFRYWHHLTENAQLHNALFYSMKIAMTSALLSVGLAYPLALWLRKPFSGSSFIAGILKAPLLVHGLVAAFLYVNFISFNGFLNLSLVHLGITERPLRMQNDAMGIGVIILQVWKQMPFALLLLSDAVKTIGEDIIDAARDLGAGPWRRFRCVILPLTVRALQAAMIIIFIGAAGDYSFQVIAGPTRVNSLAQLMYRLQSEAADGWNQAATVAVVLMAASLAGALLLALLSQQLIHRGARK
ncbi:Putrescine transport system permease protein PotH [Vibrio aerogenes CECT 7868]|uniref:Putrescine transport system permease protein PotH n=1 Tax=Vibrio aerogenes CECT 7868 TaxID=1216006 RepID=A0A1M5ZQ24_9VIBR|nr:ABC transporter permease [Vibrio aerogenes]SHI26206.1 Putrescine transport system permease protein PotH [Vibrio aerogenes CECT 7868]